MLSAPAYVNGCVLATFLTFAEVVALEQTAIAQHNASAYRDVPRGQVREREAQRPNRPVAQNKRQQIEQENAEAMEVENLISAVVFEEVLPGVGLEYVINHNSITIRELRKQKGFTQQQVVDRLNIDRSTYAYYESGRSQLNINIVVDLAHLFQVSYALSLII